MYLFLVTSIQLIVFFKIATKFLWSVPRKETVTWSIWPTEKASTQFLPWLLMKRVAMATSSFPSVSAILWAYGRQPLQDTGGIYEVVSGPALPKLTVAFLSWGALYRFVIPLPRSKAYNYALRFHKMILGSSDLAKDPPRYSVFWYLNYCGFFPFLPQVPPLLHSLCPKLLRLGSILERLTGNPDIYNSQCPSP